MSTPENRSQCGRVLRLSRAQGGEVVQGIAIPQEQTERNWIVALQVRRWPTYTSGEDSGARAGTLTAHICYGLGGATFSKNVRLVDTVARRFPIVGNVVEIDLRWDFDDGETTSSDKLEVRAAVVPALPIPLADYWAPHWVSDPGFFTTNPRQLSTVPSADDWPDSGGYMLLAASGFTIAMGGATVLYPMLFDAATAPAPGALPVTVGPPQSAAGGTFEFEDEASAQYGFTNGVWFALSADPAVFAAPPAGAAARCDVKLGD